MAAETAGCPMNTDERLLVSPMGQQEVLTGSVGIPNKIGDDNKQTREDEDEHIDRLVQEGRDDNKSVRSFGKRTDVPICTRVNLRGRNHKKDCSKRRFRNMMANMKRYGHCYWSQVSSSRSRKGEFHVHAIWVAWEEGW